MENIINEMVDNFKGNLQDFFLNGKRSLAEAEQYFREHLSGVVTGLLPAYHEKLNEQIVEDKAGRREAGLQVERHGDKRTILTTLGEVKYRRTYYRTKAGEYCYPVDAIADVESRQRLATGVNEELVKNACAMSCEKSARTATGNHVSRQTVMNKIRECSVPDTPEAEKKPKPTTLHIDADENHITLRGGLKKEENPLSQMSTKPAKRKKRKPSLFLPAFPTRTGRSLFLPVPAK